MAIVYLFVAIGLFLGAAAYYISEKYKDVAEEEGLTENKSSFFGPCDKACVYCPPKSCDLESGVPFPNVNLEDCVPFPQELYVRVQELTKDIDPGDLDQPLPNDCGDKVDTPFPQQLYACSAELTPGADTDYVPEPHPEENSDGSNYVIETKTLAEILAPVETPVAVKKKKAVAKNKNTSSKTKKSNKKTGTK